MIFIILDTKGSATMGNAYHTYTAEWVNCGCNRCNRSVTMWIRDACRILNMRTDHLLGINTRIQYRRAKPKGSNCVLFKWAVTAFWLCTAEHTDDGRYAAGTSLSHCHPDIRIYNTRRSAKVVLMLAQRLRRWANIKTALGVRVRCILLAVNL